MISWTVNSNEPLLDRTQGIISPLGPLSSTTTFPDFWKTRSAASAIVWSSPPEIPWHRMRNAPNSLAERSIRSAEPCGSDRRSISAGAGGRCVPGSVSSGSCSDFSRNWLKVSLAAERIPLPVGIGDGSGAGIWLLQRLIEACVTYRRE